MTAKTREVKSSRPKPSNLQRRLDQVAARRDALAGSEPNRRCHELVEAAREFRELLDLFLDEVPGNAGVKVLEAAGLEDPGGVANWCGDTFHCTIEKAQELVRTMDDFISLAPCDLPPLPAAAEGGGK